MEYSGCTGGEAVHGRVFAPATEGLIGVSTEMWMDLPIRRIVKAAERSMEDHLLPRGFAGRCICACNRALEAKQKEVLSMTVKKDCGCGCQPPAKKKTTVKNPPKSKPASKRAKELKVAE